MIFALRQKVEALKKDDLQHGAIVDVIEDILFELEVNERRLHKIEMALAIRSDIPRA